MNKPVIMLMPSQRQIQHRRPRSLETLFCQYEACEFRDMTNLIHLHGKADILNRSVDGILLSIEFAPRLGQILELVTSESFLCRSVSLYEVRWTKPESSLNVSRRTYRVGCRLVFGPLQYCSF